MKHTRKRILAFVLALALTVSLCACGKSGGSSGGGFSLFGKSPEPVLVRAVATRLEDGAVVSDSHYAYDEYGNKTAEITYQFGLLPNGYYSYEYEYGRGGVPAKRSTYAMAKGLSLLTAEETFDSDGNVISRREYDITGELTAEYAYDSNGNTTLQISYINGKTDKTETTYYEDGSEMAVRYTFSDGSGQYWEYLPKDDKISGRSLKARTEIDANGNETRYDYTLEKDEHGNLLCYSAVNAATGELDFRQDCLNMYDNNGNLTSIEVTDENGACIQQEYFQYDEKGNLIYDEDTRDINNFFSHDTFTFTYNDAGTRIQSDYTHYQKTSKGYTMNSTSHTYYDDQGDMTGYDYEEEQGRLSFEIGRVAGKQVVLNKWCTNLRDSSQFDFEMVFTGDNKYTEDYSHYFNGDLAFDALDYTRSYTYDDNGNLTAIEEWENGAETPTQRWDYTYALPKEAPELNIHVPSFTGNNASAVRLYDANDSLLGEAFLTYNEDGRWAEMVSNGVTYTYDYEDTGDGSYVAYQHDPDGSISQKLTYDQQGNLVENTQYAGNFPTFQEYGYDSLGNQAYGALWGIGCSGYYAYEYDAYGNHTGVRLYASYSYEAGTMQEYADFTCDEQDRLTRLDVYDASGTLEGYVTYEYTA